MAIVWILGILALLVGAGALIDRKHRSTGTSEMPAADRQAERSRRWSASGASTSSWGFFGGDGGGGFGGGFDGGGFDGGGGCGGDGGGGASC